MILSDYLLNVIPAAEGDNESSCQDAVLPGTTNNWPSGWPDLSPPLPASSESQMHREVLTSSCSSLLHLHLSDLSSTWCIHCPQFPTYACLFLPSHRCSHRILHVSIIVLLLISYGVGHILIWETEPAPSAWIELRCLVCCKSGAFHTSSYLCLHILILFSMGPGCRRSCGITEIRRKIVPGAGDLSKANTMICHSL